MATLAEVLSRHRDISKETLQTLCLGVDSNLVLIPLKLNADGSLPVSSSDDIPTKIENGIVVNVLPAVDTILKTYTVPIGKKATILSSCFSGSGYGTFTLKYDGVNIGQTEINYFRRVSFWTQKLNLVAGESLSVYVKNNSPHLKESNDFEVWIYIREENV
jgi:hypothetical protein